MANESYTFTTTINDNEILFFQRLTKRNVRWVLSGWRSDQLHLGYALSLLWVAEALEQLKDQYDGSALGNHSEKNDHRIYVDLDQQDVGLL